MGTPKEVPRHLKKRGTPDVLVRMPMDTGVPDKKCHKSKEGGTHHVADTTTDEKRERMCPWQRDEFLERTAVGEEGREEM